MRGVEVEKLGQVRVRKVVGVEDQELLAVGHELAVSGDGPGASEQLWLHDGMDTESATVLGRMSAHLIREMMEVDQDITHTMLFEQVAPPIEEWTTGDRNEAFREMISHGTKSRAESCGKKDCFQSVDV